MGIYSNKYYYLNCFQFRAAAEPTGSSCLSVSQPACLFD